MYIARSNHGFQHKAVLVTGGMGLIGKLPLVLSFTNRPLSGVRYAPGHRSQLLLLPTGQLLL